MLRTTRLSVIVAFVLVSGFAAVPVARPTPTPVPSYIFYWNRLDTDLTVLGGGHLRVVETWRLAYVKGAFSSGSRSLALSGGRDVRDVDVTVDGRALTEAQPGKARTNTFTLTRDEGNLRIDWYYPKASSPSSTTFVIGYTMSGVVELDPAGDSVNWLGVFTRTRAPVRAARITVHLPEGAQVLNARSKGAPATYEVDAGTVAFNATGVIPPEVSLTTQVDFTHGLVQPETTGNGEHTEASEPPPDGGATPTPAGG